jgi:hypothetical protein
MSDNGVGAGGGEGGGGGWGEGVAVPTESSPPLALTSVLSWPTLFTLQHTYTEMLQPDTRVAQHLHLDREHGIRKKNDVPAL